MAFRSPIRIQLPWNADSPEGKAILQILEGVSANYQEKTTSGLTANSFSSAGHPINMVDRYIGRNEFDTSTNRPLWWNGYAWVDATGAAIYVPA